ncbi:hypothetical protein FOL47_000676 [Perkinsus chesapeaki]|uniref:Mitochondrial import receptor subunit TOM40B n=1 Tax=Perkinsus chesapeaki TaxID=330153 RepID=A0A7J6KVG3_PERCH|nr:hypothetical protein FOL47_000676 [Perkinsus chesapeaki]
MLKAFVAISIAAVGLTLKLDEVYNNLYDEDSMAQLFGFLKELETEVKSMNEERMASFPKGVQQAQVDDAGKFSYPPGCNATTQIINYSYCFHGYLNQTPQATNENSQQVDAVVDFFDLDKAEDNAVIGLRATYTGTSRVKSSDFLSGGQSAAPTASELEVHAGGDAKILSFGNPSRAGTSIHLETYDEQLDQPQGIGELTKRAFVAKPRFLIYGLSKRLGEIIFEPGDDAVSYVFMGKAYNLGFNVSVYKEEKVKLGFKIGGALDLSLTTVKRNLTNWFLKGSARVVVKPPIGPNFNFPYYFLSTAISL